MIWHLGSSESELQFPSSLCVHPKFYSQGWGDLQLYSVE